MNDHPFRFQTLFSRKAVYKSDMINYDDVIIKNCIGNALGVLLSAEIKHAASVF
ncbi:hypothetical protein BAXH7_02146 [Bacillus amyloliquefaciens XH7]|nr:hypothetical protein LL3_01429 [Bacillus amyloliquefaciens LL3]AEK89278.1 hypothetical protein BAXH7_02146 [Bacillus amyloliquefaciens XH7]KYC94456.1 hypothetical protein B425_1366 [Bacillus amyloliquefaciens]QBG55764.1 hypothetical protein D2M30_1434 [Bacillus amyloliquefaciens]